MKTFILTVDNLVIMHITDETAGVQAFYTVADLFAKKFSVKFSEKLDEFYAQEWEFKYRKHVFKLHYSIYHGVYLSYENRVAESTALRLVNSVTELEFA